MLKIYADETTLLAETAEELQLDVMVFLTNIIKNGT